VSWVVVQGRGHFWHLNHVFDGFWPGRLRNVRLAALDLMEISGVDLEGSGLDPWILGFPRVHLNSRVSHFLSNVTFFCVNSVEFVFLDSHRNSWRTLFWSSGATS